MKTKLALIIAATLVSTGAFAKGGNYGYHGGYNPYYAEDNYAEVTLTDSLGTTAKSEQTSTAGGSTAVIEAFDADRSSFQIYQYTDDNFAVIKALDGAHDYKKDKVIIEQTGSDNKTAVIMSGGTDKADVHLVTIGEDNKAMVELVQANGSEVIGDVTGELNKADIKIAYGDKNKVDFTQDGNDNDLDVLILGGDGNKVYVNQTSDKAFAEVYVKWSDNNVITVNQTYGDVAKVTAVGGGSNIVTVNQY